MVIYVERDLEVHWTSAPPAMVIVVVEARRRQFCRHWRVHGQKCKIPLYIGADSDASAEPVHQEDERDVIVLGSLYDAVNVNSWQP